MQTTATNGTVYELHGDADAPVIALVHGLGLTRATWDGHIEALSQNHRLVNYDLFGHGDSALPPETPSLSMFARQLRDLLDELNIDKANVVGFSLGGMINRRFAIDFPDRTLALGIFNSPHERDPVAQRQIEERAVQSDSGGPGANLDATIKRWFTADFIEREPQFINRIRGWVLANNPAAYAQCRAVLAAGVTELIRPDPPLNLPALVITCEHDTGSTPAMTHAIADEIIGGQALVIPHLQHMGLTQEPSLFTQPMLTFLQSL